MTSPIETIRGLIQDYIDHGDIPEKEESLAQETFQRILAQLSSLSLQQRWSVIRKVKASQHTEKKTALKKSISGTTSKWKDVLLGVDHFLQLNVHHHPLTYSNSLDHPISFDGRFSLFAGSEVAGIVGSTFATNKPERLDDKGHQILDAIYASSCSSGYALALGDGAGGHFGEPTQDHKIARASHFGTKSCVRFLSAYDKPKQLREDLLDLIELVGEEINDKALCEGTTLVACRAFPQGKNYWITGVNIGDSMLVGWDPISKTVYHLLPSRATEAGTAIIPTAYRPFEVHTINDIVPAGTILFLMSDGVHDELPYEEKEETYPNKLTYRTRSLRTLETILGDIPPDAPVDIFLRKIIDATLDSIEQKRKKAVEAGERTQIGDDVSIVGCRLPYVEGSEKCTIN
ncbi:MAG: hypothetical protein K940chlam7_01074 [Chlamydiae bacterium]|nr:hypothetical protein [Chlamydiota bacterium]